jgi:hypothetical protein
VGDTATQLPDYLRQRIEEARRIGPWLPETFKEQIGVPQMTPEHAEAIERLDALVRSVEPEEHPARAALHHYLDALNTLQVAQDDLRRAVAEHIPDPPGD